MASVKSNNSRPRTFAEFEKFRQALFAKDFESRNLHPIAFGLERTQFEIERLKQLIQVAEGIEGITIRARLEGWRRQLRRMEAARDRFSNLVKVTEAPIRKLGQL